ncbi:MAG: AarF/ABC1/UbiB kinase family protein [Anaerolineaceae bacterium]|nr:AarF/ABC1/UbiB kinase family protein [Anaerolineaceae bacterium]
MNSRSWSSTSNRKSNLPEDENDNVTPEAQAAVQNLIAQPAARGRSLRMQVRFWRTLLFAAGIFARILLWRFVMPRLIGKERAGRGSMDRWVAYARKFRRFAVAMGGLMIKLGQFVSTRVDVLPPEITDELAGLQDEVPSAPFAAIEQIIIAELGPLQKRYQWFNQEPVAAASLGQVYRAQLLNGDRVVVKVQRPGIREVVYTDLAALRIVALVAWQFRFIRRRADTPALAEEFARVSLEELSYEQEARNAARFAAMFQADMGVYIPAVYPEHSTDSILTMEDVTTIKISDFAAIEAAGISRKAIAKRLMNASLKQVFEERFFHADPHPGNLFVYPLPHKNGSRDYGKTGRPFYLIFVDFGMTGSLTAQISDGVLNTMAAIVTRNPHQLVQSYAELGFLLPDADLKRLEEATAATFDRVWGLNMTEIKNVSTSEVRDLTREFNDLLYDMPFRVPQDFIYLGRALGILSGMATSLDPDFNAWQELLPYAQKMITQSARQSKGLLDDNLLGLLTGASSQALLKTGREMLTQTVTLPLRINTIVSQLEKGELTVRTAPAITSHPQSSHFQSQRQLTHAVIFSGLLVSAAILYTGGAMALAGLCAVACGFTFLRMVLLWE